MTTHSNRSEIVELRRRTPAGIVAVSYRRGRKRRAFRLLDGSIVETPAPDQRCDAPDNHHEAVVGIKADGTPATVHDANLGLISGYLDFDGFCLLPSGDIAAIYGARIVPIG